MDPLSKELRVQTDQLTSKSSSKENVSKTAALPLEKILAIPDKSDLSLKSRQISKQSDADKIEVQNRDGHLWNCIKRRPNPNGGYIYTFRFRPEFDFATPDKILVELNQAFDLATTDEEKNELKHKIEITEKERDDKLRLSREVIQRIFPAIESLPNEIDDYWKDFDKSLFESIGYKFINEKGNILFEAPDEVALQSNWEIYRQSEGRNLPPIKVLTSEGIADDISFVQAHTEYDIVISNREECAHDNMAHALVTISEIAASQTPAEDRRLMKSVFLTVYKTLRYAEKYVTVQLNTNPELKQNAQKIEDDLKLIKAGLGSFVDSTTASPRDYNLTNKDIIDIHLGGLAASHNWTRYFTNRFGEEQMREASLPGIWREMIHMAEIWKKAKEQGLRLENAEGVLSVYHKEPVPFRPGFYQIAGSQDSIQWQESAPRLTIIECNDLENHRHLMDLTCQYASKHQFQEIAVSLPGLDWKAYFEMGFRPETAGDDNENADMMLISTAISLNLLTDEEQQLLVKLSQFFSDENAVPLSILDDPEVSANMVYVPVDPAFQTTDHPEINFRPTFSMKLQKDVFDDWKQIAQTAKAKEGSPIQEAGLKQLHKDLENLRQRLNVLNRKFFGPPKEDIPPADASACNIL